MDHPPPTMVDTILHPLASLECSYCDKLPVGMQDAQAVWLRGKLYVGGGKTSLTMREDDARLYIYTHMTDRWSIFNTPVCYFALVTYSSRLVIVGGKELDGELVTNKLRMLDSDNRQWSNKNLPPMTKERHGASAVEYLKNIIVAGGFDDVGSYTAIVEVYDGFHWGKAQSLPTPCYNMKSTHLDGNWYLMGGVGQVTTVFYTSLAQLVSTRQPTKNVVHVQSVWNKLNAPLQNSSITVFRNKLIAIGGYPLSSSVFLYSTHSQSWMHVGDMPVKLDGTCTTVLPTGMLMIIGGRSLTLGTSALVYQATWEVSYDPNSQFTSEALSRFKYFSINLSKDLENNKDSFRCVIGIDSKDVPLNFNSSTILNMWLQGHGSLHPTWLHLLWALRKIDMKHLADQCETLLNVGKVEQAANDLNENLETEEADEDRDEDIDDKDLKHIAAVQKAMEERGMLDHTIVHGVFVGPARSGKNSTMERLLGRMPSSFSPSTGVADSVVQVKVMQKSTTFPVNVEKPDMSAGESAEKSHWSVMDYDDEAIKLMLINRDSQNIVEVAYIEVGDVKEPLSDDVTNSNADCPDLGCSQILATDSENDTKLCLQEASLNPLTCTPHPKLPASYVSPIEIVKGALRKKGKGGLQILQQHFQKTWSLYLTNTGGQIEFQEVLPLLVSGPSIFFFIFRLDRDLNELYSIEYELADGSNAKPYTSTLTTLEGILQTLSSISAMGTFVYKGLQKREVPLRPKVFLIGTHKDLLNPKNAKDRIAKIDQQLQKALKSTTHYEELVEFAYPSQLIFTVSNSSPEGESDFRDIRSAVERVVIRDEFQMTSPAHWLIFSLALRKLKDDVISYDLCLEIARKCGLQDSEIDDALQFIHSKMGLIRYFPYEDVKNIVVIDPQHLFDQVTELIVNTFTFEKAGKQLMDTFKQRGIFSLVEFDKINSRTGTSIKPFIFAKLLERLRIAAAFQMKKNVMYFFPCALAHVDTTVTKKSFFSKLISSANVPLLFVGFKCGYCPKGLPGALVSYLMANEMNSSFSWELCHEEIFRNQVSFAVGPLDIVVLNIYSTHLKITFVQGKRKKQSRDVSVRKVCSAVCKAIEAGIIQIAADLNYVSIQHYMTFQCRCKGDHPGVLQFVSGTPYNLSCRINNKKYNLPKNHDLWPISRNDKDVQASCVNMQSHDPENHSSLLHQQASPLNGFCELNTVEHRQLNRLTDNHHSVLLKQLSKHAAAWREIGTYLGFTQGELENIQARPFLLNRAPVSWLSAILAQWLQWAPGDGRGSTGFATLDGLKSALSEAGLGATAHDLGV